MPQLAGALLPFRHVPLPEVPKREIYHENRKTLRPRLHTKQRIVVVEAAIIGIEREVHRFVDDKAMSVKMRGRKGAPERYKDAVELNSGRRP